MSYLRYIAPGLLAASAMNGGTFETTYNVFVKMYFARTYEAVTATPVTIADAMAGEILWGITRGTIYGSAFAAVMTVFGLFGHWTAVLVLPLIVLTAWLFAAMGLLYTSLIRVIDLYSFYYTLWLTPLFLFSGIFFPLSTLPEWARAVAWATPLYHCVNLMKAAAHGSWSASSWLDLLWVLAASLITSIWALRRVERRFSA
jgi:lipooligosaccharide transport system permease protein